VKTHRNGNGEGAPPQPSDDVLDGLFRSARVDGFSATQAAVLWGRVGAATAVTSAGGAGSAASGGGSAGTAGSTGVTSLKAAAIWLLGGSLVMASAGLTTVGVAGRALPNPETSPGVVAVVDPPAPARAEPSPAGDRPASGPELEPVPGAPRALRTAPVVAEPAGGAHARPGAASRPGAEAVDTPPSRAEVAPSRGVPNTARGESLAPSRASDPSGSGGDGPITSSPPSPTEPSISEGALLLRARRVLASDPAEALELTRQHARRFPTGALIPERQVLAIEALAGLGRTAEARAELASFRQRFPSSPHLARLQALLANK